MSVENLRLFWVPVNLDCLHVGLLELYAADYCTMNPSSSALSRMYRILEEKPVGSAARRFLAVGRQCDTAGIRGGREDTDKRLLPQQWTPTYRITEWVGCAAFVPRRGGIGPSGALTPGQTGRKALRRLCHH